MLALMRETVKENDEPERMPPPPAVKGGCNHIFIIAAGFYSDQEVSAKKTFPAQVNVVVVSGLF